MFRFFESLVAPFGAYDDQAPVPNRLLPFMLVHLRPFRKVLALATLFTAAVTLIEIGLIWYAGRLVDLLAAAEPAEFLSAHGAELAAVAAFLLVIRPAIQFIGVALLNQSLMPNLGTLMRWRGHRRMLRQSVGFFQADFAGRIASRVMQTAPSMGEAAFQIFDALVYATIYLVGAAVMLAGTDPRLALPLVIWAAAYFALLAWFTPRIGKASQAFSDARSAITGRIVDAYSNIQTVKLFSHAAREENYAKEAIERGRATFAAEMRLVTGIDLGLVLINGFLMVGVVGWAIRLWAEGAAGVGAVAAATALVMRLNAMTGWIMWALSSLFQNLGVIAEGMETIAAPIELNDRPGAPDLRVGAGAIRFEDVRHAYGRGGRGGGLHGVDLSIRGGERIGLVGRSGAGKSTLVNLLLRFMDAETGRILIDGQDVSAVGQESLRAAVGMVTQDTSLLHRSVRENIAYGRPGASDAEIMAAAERVAAAEFIAGLVDPEGRRGLDAMVGERGVKLSGGQRQRVALARVVLKDAPILVLDEATSALDSEVEAAIEGSLAELMEGKTVIAIAHRLSTIARMDRIVVLDEGRVVEAGPHVALVERGGVYARLWARQSGGFLGLEAAE